MPREEGRSSSSCATTSAAAGDDAEVPAWRRGLMARKEAWRAADAPSVAVAVGNSAGDLDSIVSALATAHLIGGVAMASFGRRELRLRRDALAALSHYGFKTDPLDGSISELAYADDAQVDWTSPVVLVDHNRLELGFVGGGVIGILDHHADEGLFFPLDENEKALFRVVDPACGSTATLVAERLLSEDSLPPPPPDLLGLLASTIALDTRGFDDKQRRFSSRDVEVLGDVLDRLGAPPSARIATRRVPGGLGPTVADVARLLLDKRADVADLSARELLRMDYKQASAGDLSVGVAGVLLDLPGLVQRARDRDAGASVGQLLAELAQEKSLHLAVALTKKDKHTSPGAATKAIVIYCDAACGLDLASLEADLVRLPEGLPPTLADLPLFQSQNITHAGLGDPRFGDLDADARFALIAPQLTRKTLLPTLLHFTAARSNRPAAPQGKSSS